jgi:eight-cysteine-cluster-containing protein
MRPLLLLALSACGSLRPAPAPAPSLDPDPDPAAPPTAPETTPAALYAECASRVEGPEADGECSTDADCTRAGCGSEVCATTAAAADLMTTCEDRPCFAVLDTCGCHDGRCTWTLRAPASPPP